MASPAARQGATGRKLASALSACVLLTAAGPALAEPAARLEAVDQDDEVLARRDLEEGDTWCLAWNHSVEGFTVLDCYVFRDARMVLQRSHLPDFAAGLDHIPGRGEQVSDGEGGYWIEEIDEPVPDNRYTLRVGADEVDHRLRWEEDDEAFQVSLSAQAAGERVTLRIVELDD